MNLLLNIQNITLTQIDFDDFFYSISPEREIVVDETLKKSIANHGILHPPIVRETNSGFYSIVAGRKRLLAVRSLQTENTCACLVISLQVPEVDVFCVLLEEIQLTRQLSIVEKAIFCRKIAAIMDEKQIIREFLPNIGLAPNTFAMKQTLMLLDLEDPILSSIHHGQINETVARDFILLSAQDRIVLLGIIAALRLSSSNQKKLLNICRELASRENTSIAALLGNDEVQGILHHQAANPPQKTKNLMTWLSGKYMPRSRQAEKEFRRFTNAMQLPENISVEHTPFFEDDSMTLSIIFPNRNLLQHTWEKIRHAIHSNDN